MQKFLGITGILLILSLFTGSPLILTICLTLFIVAVVINFGSLYKNKNVICLLFDETEKKTSESLKNKQYGKAFIYGITSPMVVIGIVMVLLCMICMWSMIL